MASQHTRQDLAMRTDDFDWYCSYEDEGENGGCAQNLLGVIVAFIILCVCVMLGGCKTRTVVVTVPEVRTEYVHTTDSIHHTDSIIKEKETTIMMLDSAAMAEYGIKLQAAERAWLVKTKELERELQRIAKMKSDTIIQIDSIPYPVPVPEYIEKELSWWQKMRMGVGSIALIMLLVWIVWQIAMYKMRRF